MKAMQSRLSLVVPALLAAAWGGAAPQALAQPAYPSRNVQIVVPYSAGGSIDLFSRAIGKRLTEAWGRTVVIDNRPGASGMIGT